MGVEIAGSQLKVEHPFRKGLEADTQSIDELWSLLSTVKDELTRLRACEGNIRRILGEMAEGDSDRKTRRLVGEKVKLKLTFPGDQWSQSILKELAKEDPEQAAVYLRVSRYDPNLREVKKLEAAYGNERFERFKEKLLSARQPSASPPTVSVEE